MKQKFQDQFDNLKLIIESNVTAIKGLIKQSEQLSEIIQKIERSEASALKEQLETSKNEIMKSIDVLVKQTQNLFKVYENLIDQVFGK